MQAASAGASVLHRGDEDVIRKEIAFLDHQIDLGYVHVNDASGANIQVTDFAVAHLPDWQSYIASAGVHQCAGILVQ